MYAPPAMSLDEGTIRREAEALRALLELLLPEYRARRSEVVLARASAPVRALWETIGYSTAFRPFVQDPDEDSGRREVEHVIDGWRARTSPRGALGRLREWLVPRTAAAARPALPTRFRFVGVSERWDAIDVTDENAGDDPPIVRVRRDRQGLERTGETYLRRTARGLLEKALAVSGCELTMRPDPDGEPLTPNLAPELTRVADGIWRVRGHAGGDRFAFASWDRLCTFVNETATSIEHFHTTNGCFVPLKPELKRAVQAAGRWREYRREGSEGAQIEWVGFLEDIPAWITLEPGTEALTGMSVSTANRDRLLAWIEVHAGAAPETAE